MTSLRYAWGLAASLLCYLAGVPLLTCFVAPGGVAALLLTVPLYAISWTCGTRWGLLAAAAGIAYNSVNWVILGNGGSAVVSDGVAYLVVLYLVECVGAALFVLLVGSMRTREQARRRELERSKDLLRLSEEKYRHLVDGAPEGVWVVENARVSFCNAHFADMLGYTVEEIRGMPVETLNYAEDRQRAMARYAARAAGKLLPKSITRHVRKDGGILWVETIGHRIDWEGRPAVLYFSSDITERKAVEEQFAQAQKMEAIGRLAGGIAHDFNNLLQVILGFCSMLRSYPEDRRAVLQDLEVIEDSARKAASLTQQLLAFSRKQVIRPQVVDLRTLVSQSQRMLSRVLGENIELVVAPAAEEGLVRADPGQLQQIIMNLAINARDAMPEGGRITLEAANVRVPEGFRPDLPAGEYVRLTVEDTGRGMNARTLEHIFEPFFTTKTSGEGTGLGLSIVYGIVRQNGGHIHARSTPGQGSTFAIFLPRVVETRATEEPPAPAEGLVGTGSVLVVEDQEAVRGFIQIVLERAGFTVAAAPSGEQAMRIFCDLPGFDLLVTDVALTGMSGDALADSVRRLKPSLPVIYMSGYLNEQQAARLRGAPLLLKPFSAEDLLSLMKQVLPH